MSKKNKKKQALKEETKAALATEESVEATDSIEITEEVSQPAPEIAHECSLNENTEKLKSTDCKKCTPMFPTSVFGFNKASVAAYILKQDEEFFKKLSELNREVDRLSDLLEEKERETECLKQRLEALLIEDFSDVDKNKLSENEQESFIDSIKSKSNEILEKAMEKAQSMIKIAEEKAKAEREKYSDELNHNLRKLKYLYKKQDELQAFFNMQKEKADSFYSDIIDKE